MIARVVAQAADTGAALMIPSPQPPWGGPPTEISPRESSPP
jgi:hypothetical protein